MKKVKSPWGSRYGKPARILHGLALGIPFVAETSFDIEQVVLRPDISSVVGRKHVFIAGLARSGTTLLMRRFYASGRFFSLTYRDMPFVLMPSLWRKVSAFARQRPQRQERAHGDGIFIDHDSPEALEEVFWRTFTGHEYIRSDKLIPVTPDDEVIARFRAYVASILSQAVDGREVCYLSKNNNNILRLPSLRKAFPGALIIVPYRDPLQQAMSLLCQHQRFLRDEKMDTFTSRYMRWLGHHEFGADHRPFCFGKGQARYHDSSDLNYWIELWLNTYAWLDAQAPDTALFLSYETFCRDTARVWERLSAKACSPIDIPLADAVIFQERREEAPVDRGLLAEADKVYASLAARASWTDDT